jgi:hypothetical protein
MSLLSGALFVGLMHDPATAARTGLLVRVHLVYDGSAPLRDIEPQAQQVSFKFRIVVIFVSGSGMQECSVVDEEDVAPLEGK